MTLYMMWFCICIWYDFVFVYDVILYLYMMWRDAVNTALTSFKTITPELINTTGNKENGIVEKRIEQITNRCDKEVERVIPKIVEGATEQFYKILFCLARNFDRLKYSQAVGKVKRPIRKSKTKKIKKMIQN